MIIKYQFNDLIIMGIQGLSDFLKKKFPTVYKEISIDDLRYKKIAVDTSLYLYKYKVINNDNWMDCFIRLICCLRKFDVHPIFIFDTSAPIEKIEEQKRRRQQVQDRRDNIDIIEKLVEKYYEDNIIDSKLQEFYDKKIKYQKKVDDKRLLIKKLTGQEEKAPTFDIEFIEKEIEKIKSQNISISSDDILKLKELFDILGVQYFQALQEAEQTCSYMSHWGLVDGVLTEDSDVIAYGIDLFISKINTFNGDCTLIESPNLLDKLEFSKEQLLDFCIMLQCDYNQRIPKIGPVASYKLLQEYGTLDDIAEKTDMDLECLKYKRCRELFSCIDNQGWFDVKYNKEPDYYRLGDFLNNINSQISFDKIKKDCGRININ